MTKSIIAILALFSCAFAFAAQAQSTDLEQGLSVYLPMTIDLLDHSAHKLPVTVSGKVVIQDGAARFEGKEDWLELPHVPLNNRPFAIAMWIKVTGKYPVYGIVEQRAAKIVGGGAKMLLVRRFENVGLARQPAQKRATGF
jgi:hypothetical protein